MRILLALLVLMVTTIGVPSVVVAREAAPATGAEIDEARTLVRQATALYAESKFREAVTLYQRAFKIFPTPNTAFNLAQCHRQLGQYEEAISHYGTYLTMSPRAPNRPLVESLVVEMRRSLDDRKRTSQLPPQATLS